ncbi:beta-14-mannosyl-glycoprotein beta-14-n-acetylglucosaminyl-transferase [Holotrichia oblita]|uniref:Beta-14-mannosyl-glycoprotein beta-14-n-acetylglucosaminyl-transferase n=1 Tax=Holotrichia oblita TaxID=644536 RepID=A0ACB9T803_HOLOL|nr:beta-14-mannosyl-glycoprotein beta-14-n-acetylglucosaminyl-transferase [Holotrichia oblita]
MNRDDILLMSGNSEIPNKAGILFLKFYNGWPEPINFRLKYSVYGFYWIHPTKTVLNGGACTIEYVEQILNGDLKYLNSNKSLSNLSSKNFIIGDLNHYGGWFCEFCNDPTIIINHLNNLTSSSLVNWENVNKIDNMYLESLIENGVYLDGKTTLNRAHRYHENYFAPTYVNENSWKYDFLLTNIYSKMDYYD